MLCIAGDSHHRHSSRRTATSEGDGRTQKMSRNLPIGAVTKPVRGPPTIMPTTIATAGTLPDTAYPAADRPQPFPCILRGVAASPGCVEGAAFLYRAPDLRAIPKYVITTSSIDAELARLERAIKLSSEEIHAVRERVARDIGKAEAGIFDTHLLFLEDPHLVDRICARVRCELVNVEQALADEIRESMAKLERCASGYMRERATDLRDVGNRLVRNLIGHDGCSLLASLPRQSIVVAEELTPSDTITMDRLHVVGLATENGGATSHAAILARSMGIPAVTGIHGMLANVLPDTPLVLDGIRGLMIVNPSTAQSRRFAAHRRRYETVRRYVGAEEHRECVMRDGTRISLMANIGHAADIPLVRECRLDGVGLFRSELLYLKNVHPPGLGIQRRDYLEAAAALAPLPLTIRTFDFSTDKRPRFLNTETEVAILNGLRGLRFSLRESRLLKIQLRALAAVCRQHANVRILFPMVVGRGCLREALAILDQQCDLEGLSQRPAVGAMIETPSAVFGFEDIVDLVDFVNIGSNDLAQYVLAEDRCHARMEGAELLLHPSMLRAIRSVVAIADARGCPVGLCGEAAGDPVLAAVIAGLGVRCLSMSPVLVQGVRFALRRLSLDDAAEMVRHALAAETPGSVFQLARERYSAAFVNAAPPGASRHRLGTC